MNSPVMQTADRAIAGTYLRYPIALTSGHGCRLVDDAGREYIDFLAGIAVCNFGHAHPAIVQALTDCGMYPTCFTPNRKPRAPNG
jgi:acetylornithine/N-succinyldiaminopimelate aminotransferase